MWDIANDTTSSGHTILRIAIRLSSGWNLFVFLLVLLLRTVRNGELYLAIKRKLYSGRKDDPATRVEIRIDQDVFDEGLAKQGSQEKKRQDCLSNRLQ